MYLFALKIAVTIWLKKLVEASLDTNPLKLSECDYYNQMQRMLKLPFCGYLILQT